VLVFCGGKTVNLRVPWKKTHDTTGRLISDEEWGLLQIHMAYCESCRQMFEQAQESSADTRLFTYTDKSDCRGSRYRIPIRRLK